LGVGDDLTRLRRRLARLARRLGRNAGQLKTSADLQGQIVQLRGENARILQDRARAAEELLRLQSALADCEQSREHLQVSLDALALGWPPGHFYSPIPSLDEVRAQEHRIFPPAPAELPGIDLNLEGQRRHLEAFSRCYAEQPFTDEPGTGRRYGFKNPNFSYGEAIVLYGMMRSLEPARIIEVGSGHSSCAILDINERFFGGGVSCAFVEPYPQLLLNLIPQSDRDRIRLYDQPAQDVPFAEFEALGRNDILFIDSSHVSKVGSDVNHLMLDVIPRLRAGVFIHIHDIYYPFEYPPEWVYQGRAWNEAYLVRALLANNSTLSIEFFNSFWARRHMDELVAALPLCRMGAGSSLWMQKIA
jgi:hypothetical protein